MALVRYLRSGLIPALLLALLVAPAAARTTVRPGPSRQDVRQARQLVLQAQNLRQERIPLRAARAARNIEWSASKLNELGVKVDQRVPIKLNTTQEYRLLRQAGHLLRGARQGTPAHALRKQAVTRAFELHRSMYRMPRGMRAYTNAEKLEVAFNLDNPFFGDLKKLFPVVAHEMRHVTDVRRAGRLEAILKQPELAAARPGSAQHQRKLKLQAKVDALWSTPLAETRAFETQSRALALVGQPLGMWWRALQGNPIDQAYPPQQLNAALIKGYFKGLNQTVGAAMRDAPARQRRLAARYLRGYKDGLKQQAAAYFAGARSDGQADPGAIKRYNDGMAKVLDKAAQWQGSGKALTPAAARIAGLAAAARGLPAGPGVQQILRPDAPR